MVNLSIFLVHFAFSTVFGALTVRYEWKYMDFEWKNSQDKQNALDSGKYIPSNILPIDVDQQSRDGRIFVTNIRLQGAPATLSIFTNKTGEGGLLLRPYPNWDWNSRTDCNGIWSVMRVAIDEYNRLYIYILDSGNNAGTYLNDGIFSVALRPKGYTWEFTDLYYRPLAFLNQYFVHTDQLKGQLQLDYQTMNYTFPTQVTVEAFSCDGSWDYVLCIGRHKSDRLLNLASIFIPR